MSLVVVPFKDERADQVATNVAIAAAHDAVDEVWAVAAEDYEEMPSLREALTTIQRATGTATDVHVQRRIGVLRPGKGDAMNTAIELAAEQARDRVHFYDADITNFDESWISGAELAADRGYGVVRHRFPRASTDAMITWFVTRPGLATLFPGSFLPRLDQPLGGELLLTKPALEGLASDSAVRERSDWGIDTLITYSISVMGLGLYEHHVGDGKRHSLYGSLDELRSMFLECLAAVSSLKGRPGPRPEAIHGSDPPTPVPPDLKNTVGYDIDGTVRLLREGWTPDQAELATHLPDQVAEGLLANRETPTFSFMDADRWGQTLRMLLDHFELGDPAWQDLAFRLWLTRVLSYTTDQALAGFDTAMAYLEDTIAQYEKEAVEA